MSIPGSSSRTQPSLKAAVKPPTQSKACEIESVKCHCCGFAEDCTQTYIHRVRERYQGRWICGLCAEAVEDELVRSERTISVEEALKRHITFRRKFRSESALRDIEHPISVMCRILLRSLDAPRPVVDDQADIN